MLAKLPMTLELRREIIVLKAATMLHGSDAKFAIIDSAHEAKSRRKHRILFEKSTAAPVIQYQFLKSTDGTGNGTKEVPR